MITSKQRATLRGMANTMDTTTHIGKGGVTPEVIQQVKVDLKAKELIKGKVLENSMYTAREAVTELAEEAKADIVQVIGSKFVLYKKNHKDPKIVL